MAACPDKARAEASEMALHAGYAPSVQAALLHDFTYGPSFCLTLHVSNTEMLDETGTKGS